MNKFWRQVRRIVEFIGQGLVDGVHARAGIKPPIRNMKDVQNADSCGRSSNVRGDAEHPSSNKVDK